MVILFLSCLCSFIDNVALSEEEDGSDDGGCKVPRKNALVVNGTITCVPVRALLFDFGSSND